MDSAAIVSGSSLFQDTRYPRNRRAFVIGLTVALILHLGLLAYLVTQTVAVMPVAPVDSDPPFEGGVVTLEQPQPDPKPPINLHKPDNPRLIVDPIPLSPPETPGTVTSDAPPESLPNATGATEGPAQTGTGTTVATTALKWSRFPGPEALSTYYPPRALDAEVEGTATIECTVLDAKGRVGCRVISEKPGGYGFGDATRKMVERIGRVETGQGANPIGTVMRLSVAWQLPA